MNGTIVTIIGPYKCGFMANYASDFIINSNVNSESNISAWSIFFKTFHYETLSPLALSNLTNPKLVDLGSGKKGAQTIIKTITIYLNSLKY